MNWGSTQNLFSQQIKNITGLFTRCFFKNEIIQETEETDLYADSFTELIEEIKLFKREKEHSCKKKTIQHSFDADVPGNVQNDAGCISNKQDMEEIEHVKMKDWIIRKKSSRLNSIFTFISDFYNFNSASRKQTIMTEFYPTNGEMLDSGGLKRKLFDDFYIERLDFSTTHGGVLSYIFCKHICNFKWRKNILLSLKKA